MKHMGYTGNKRFWLSEMKVSESVFASANLPTQHLELCLLEDSSVETERMRCCLWLCGADAGDSKTSGPNTSHTHSSCSLCCGRPSTAFSRENKFTLQEQEQDTAPRARQQRGKADQQQANAMSVLL